MGYIPAMFSKDSVTFYLDGIPVSADKSLPNYDKLVAELRKPNADPSVCIALSTPAQAIAKAVEAATVANPTYLPAGRVSVTKSAVFYDGEQVKGVLVDRILGLLADGFDIMPMVRFLENLYRNPATYARDELYLWLERSDLPITEDGCFLAYKRVNSNFTSVHDGRTKNDPGTTVSMPRQDVDPVRAHTCSTGLHFCSKSYLSSFSGAKVILLKINPADVVSIPSDYNNAKGRAWQYEVLREIKQGEFDSRKWAAVVGVQGGKVGEVPKPTDATPALPASTAKDAAKAAKTARAAKVAGVPVTPAAPKPLSRNQTARARQLRQYGIEELRRRASWAGLKNAYRGYKAQELAEYLARKGK